MRPINTILNHAKNGEDLIKFEYKGITFNKMFKSEFFYLQSVLSSIGKSIHNPNMRITRYFESYTFYCQLCLLDRTLPKYSNVYLKYGSKPKTVKIGRCYKLNRRYTQSEREKIIKIVPVKNDSMVEQKLIRAFNEVFDKEKGKNETFIYSNLKQVIDLFDATITKNDKAELNFNESKHIIRNKLDENYQGLWISPQVVRILINNYIEDPKTKKDYDDMMDSIDSYIEKDAYMYIERNILLKQTCLYWLYHKYVVIQNNNDLMVNGSRLWNSICEAENKKFVGKSLSRFLKSKRIQRIKEQFDIAYPNEQFYTEKIRNVKQPQFNGIYVHYILTHFIVEYLDADYALIVAKLMYRRFRPKTLSGGNIIETNNNDISDNEEQLEYDDGNGTKGKELLDDDEEETPEEQEFIAKYIKNFHSIRDINILHALMMPN